MNVRIMRSMFQNSMKRFFSMTWNASDHPCDAMRLSSISTFFRGRLDAPRKITLAPLSATSITLYCAIAGLRVGGGAGCCRQSGRSDRALRGVLLEYGPLRVGQHAVARPRW